MAKPKTINDWSLDQIFGVDVLRGEVDGIRICAPWHWWDRGRFGISRESRGTEQVLRAGTQAQYPFPTIRNFETDQQSDTKYREWRNRLCYG